MNNLTIQIQIIIIYEEKYYKDFITDVIIY
jgi:hypothetical protein